MFFIPWFLVLLVLRGWIAIVQCFYKTVHYSLSRVVHLVNVMFLIAGSTRPRFSERDSIPSLNPKKMNLSFCCHMIETYAVLFGISLHIDVRIGQRSVIVNKNYSSPTHF